MTLTRLIYPDATAVTYTFDKASRLASLADWAGRSVGYTYFPDGALKDVTNPNGTVSTYAYDNARRATSILHQQGPTMIGQFVYTLDAVGNVTGLQEFVSGLTLGSPPWSTAAVLNDVQTNDQYSPDIAIGADGAAYAVWTDARTGDSDVYYSRRDYGIWSPNERVVAAIGSQYDPAVAVHGSNNVYVIWEDSRVLNRQWAGSWMGRGIVLSTSDGLAPQADR